MLNINELLGSIANATYNPQLNPDATHVDGQGNVVNSSGKPVSLYAEPNWFQRGFSPQAGETVAENRAIMGASRLGQQKTGIDTTRAGTIFGNPNPLAMASAGLTQPENTYQEQLREARTAAGLPTQQATTESNILGKQAAENNPLANSGIAAGAVDTANRVLPAERNLDVFQSTYPGWNGQGLNMFDIGYGGKATVKPNFTSPLRALMQNGNMSGGSKITAPSGIDYSGGGLSFAPAGSSLIGSSGVQPWQDNSQSTTQPPLTSNITTSPNTTLRPVAGLPKGYEFDDEGNLYHNKQLVPEDQIKGTPLEGMLNANKSIQKHLESLRNIHNMPHLPVGSRAGDYGRSVLNASGAPPFWQNEKEGWGAIGNKLGQYGQYLFGTQGQ